MPEAAVPRGLRWLTLASLLTAAFAFPSVACAGQANGPTPVPDTPVPDAPHAQLPTQVAAPAPAPCLARRASADQSAAEGAAAPSAVSAGDQAPSGKPIAKPADGADAVLPPCPSSGSFLLNLSALKSMPLINWYARFLDGPQVKPMTPKEKAWLAVRNVADPFNTLTILASSGIAVASDSHSAYGPGMAGFRRYVGVSYAQDMTGEFIGTYLIPTIVHQDPHYHRMSQASVKRRIAHCAYQVLWTQGDDGKGMVNYADVVGFAADDGIANLYVPGRDTDLRSSAERYASALALAPVDNFITEFLPDVAKKIHVRVVLIQRIINQVANKDAANSAP